MNSTTRVAFATDDTTTINQHFGRLLGFVVIEVEDGREVSRTVVERSKNADRPAGQGHDHSALLSPVSDCDILVAGGMGLPMASHTQATGLELILTSVNKIDDARDRLIEGTLRHEPDLAHAPRHS
jgi:predicted Fe-Mo cluster-binding NifX family protein